MANAKKRSSCRGGPFGIQYTNMHPNASNAVYTTLQFLLPYIHPLECLLQVALLSTNRTWQLFGPSVPFRVPCLP